MPTSNQSQFISCWTRPTVFLFCLFQLSSNYQLFYKYQIIRCIEGFIDIIGTTNVFVSCSISFLYFDKMLFALNFYSLNKIFSLFSYNCFLAYEILSTPTPSPHTHILLQPKKSRILVLRFTKMKGM